MSETDRRLASVAPLAVPKNAVLRAGSLDLPLDRTRKVVSARGLDLLRRSVDPGSPYLATVVASPPRPGELELPAAAVFADDGGRSCVLVRRSGRRIGVAVQVVSSTAGRATIAAVAPSALHAGESVAVGVAASDRTCS